VSAPVPPTVKIRAEIDTLVDGSRELVEIIEDVARLGARLIIQTAVEAEVTEFSAASATNVVPVVSWPRTAAVMGIGRSRSRPRPVR
jgi:hypothetical protein